METHHGDSDVIDIRARSRRFCQHCSEIYCSKARPTMSETFEPLLAKAKLAEQAERYDDMTKVSLHKHKNGII